MLVKEMSSKQGNTPRVIVDSDICSGFGSREKKGNEAMNRSEI